ncbi:MAG: MMPL family transporter, partial [Myxococcales bacterium]|nr:MMPL family transporter [Myxococcales bacterium]
MRLDRFIRDFGGGLPVIIAWGCNESVPCTTPLDADSLRMADALTRSLEGVPGIRRVLSPTTTPLFDSSGEEQFLWPTRESNGELARIAARDPMWAGSLIASDGGAAAIWVELESSDPRQYDESVNTLLALLAPFEREGFRFALVGDPIDFVVGGGELNQEPKKLSIVTVSVIFVALWILFGSARAPLPALATVGIAVLWTIGLMGWAGWPENEISQALVPLMLVVGVCDSVHFISCFTTTGGDGRSRKERLQQSADSVGRACLITSATTAAGFASFATSDLASFVRFGVAASFGVMAAFLLTFTLLPVLIDKMALEIQAPRTVESWRRALLLLLQTSERHASAILIGVVVIGAISAVGVSKLRVDVSKETLMGSGSRIVKWQHWLEDNLRKPDTIEVRLTIPEGLEVSDPAILVGLESARAVLESNPNLGRTRSVIEPMSRFNQILHGGDKAFYRTGDNAEQNAQLLFAIGSVDSSMLDRWITVDHRHLRVSAEADLLAKTARINVVEGVRGDLEAALPGWKFELTGPLRVFGVMVDGIHATQTRSFLSAFVLITILLMICFRSLRATCLVMVPTLLPIAVTLGAMGLAGVALDTGTSMIAAVILGIAVDDGVHLVSGYEANRAKGHDTRSSIRGAVVEIGRPVVASSIALSLGFLTLLMSSWGAIASFGFLAAVTIVIALGADLLVLPALLFRAVGRSGADSDPLPTDGHQHVNPAVRSIIGVAVPLAVIGSLFASSAQLSGDSREKVPTCEPTVSGVVMPSAALRTDCPLRAFEVVRRSGTPPLSTTTSVDPGVDNPPQGDVRVVARRSDSEVPVRIGVRRESPSERANAHLLVSAVSVLILGFSTLVFWRSSAAAAVPMLVAASCACAVLLGAASSHASRIAAWAEVMGFAVAPGVAVHLALTFPIERRILRAAPQILLLIYSCASALAIACFVGFARLPDLLALATQTALVIAAIAFLGVLSGCALAMRSEISPIERRRARVLLIGLSGVFVLSIGLLQAPAAVLASIPGESSGALSLCCLMALLVITRAVDRHRLFELRAVPRIWARRIVQGAAALLVVLLVSWVAGTTEDTGWTIVASIGLWSAMVFTSGGPSSNPRRLIQQVSQMSLLGRIHAQKIHASPSRTELFAVSLSMIQ